MPAFLLPDLGEGLTEAEIVTWRVQAGDVVTVDQTVVEVETAKAVVEVPVPFAGRVTALLVPALDTPGAVLVDATLGRAGHARALLRPGHRPAWRARRCAGRRGATDHGGRGGYRTRPGASPGHGHQASGGGVRGAGRGHAGICGQP